MISNVHKGNAFRDHIYQLLVASGKQNVEIEYNVNGVDVDVYFEESLFGRTTRRYVECKDFKRPIDNSKAGEIIHKYFSSAFSAHLIIVVSKSGFTPSAIDRFKSECNVEYFALTYHEFQKYIIDFSRYLDRLSLHIRNSKISSYYINQTIDCGGEKYNAVEYISNWIEDDDYKPLAILAGYGMGKTSLSMMVFNIQREKYNNNINNRIPILIKLGDLSNTSSIKNLFAGELTNETPVTGYNYPVFENLNENGSFLLIFDGFDEMKQAMRADSFLKVFSEINSLVSGMAKVLLLGRPNAFTSEDEQFTLLQGISNVQELQLKQPGSKQWKELYLQPFDEKSVLDFVAKYTKTYVGRSQEITLEKVKLIANDAGILNRPVHIKMLIDIMVENPDFDFKKLSNYTLYDQFMGLILKREYAKLSRENISVNSRYRAITHIAWHIWNKTSQQSLKFEDIPSSAYSFICSEIDENDSEKVKRDIVSGSILEPKGESLFYFPHRSFLEFLIARYFLLFLSADEHSDFFEKSNSEIYDFINQNIEHNKAEQLISSLVKYRGRYDFNNLKFISGLVSRFKIDLSPNSDHRIILLFIKSSGFERLDEAEIWFNNTLKVKSHTEYELLYIYYIYTIFSMSSKVEFKSRLKIIIASIFRRSMGLLSEIEANGKKSGGKGRANKLSKDGKEVPVEFRILQKSFSFREDDGLTMNMKLFFNEILQNSVNAKHPIYNVSEEQVLLLNDDIDMSFLFVSKELKLNSDKQRKFISNLRFINNNYGSFKSSIVESSYRQI